MRRGSRVAFPLVQLAAAAVALGAWVVLARTQPESYQALPVQAFTVGVPVSLVLTAGIPYLLPNHFRGPVTSGRQGPWAVPVTLAVGAVAAAAASGVLLGLLGAPAAGAVLATAALLSAGVLVAQLARVRLALPLMLFGGLAAPLVPLVWLVVALLPGPSARAVVGVVLLGAAAALLGLLCVPWAAAPGDVTRAGAALAVRASAPLVLHLVAFGALLQGPRLAATLTGAGPGDVVDAHLLMLLLGAGATGVASVHAVLSVGLQTAADDGFERRRGRTARAYAVLGAGVSTVLLLVVWLAAGVLLPGLPRLGLAGGVLAAVTMAALAAYYSVSALLLRAGRAPVLATASLTVATAYLATEAAWPAGTLLGAAARFAAAVLLLPVVLLLVASLSSRLSAGAARRPARDVAGLVRTAATAAAGLVPALLVAGTAALLR